MVSAGLDRRQAPKESHTGRASGPIPAWGPAGRSGKSARLYAQTTEPIRDVKEVGSRDPRREGDTGAGVPPFKSGFPVFTARSSRVQYSGKSGRSCSPS